MTKEKFDDISFQDECSFRYSTNIVSFILYCRDRVSSCNIYAVQHDTQSVLMSEFIQHLC